MPLTQPWNPYLPLVMWMVVLLATWAVLCGDHLMLIPLVVAASFCSQTHVPYLALGAGMFALGLGTVLVRAMRTPRSERRAPLRSAAWAVGIGIVLWIPPVVDQLVNDPGNVRQLVDHFGSPPEPALGLGEGVELALRHLDVWAGLGHQVVETGPFISAASAWRGGITLAVWVIAVIVAWRVGSRALRALHVVVGAALVLGVASMARIFGRPWFYLTLWAWGVTTLLVGAVAWTALAWWKSRSRNERRDVRTPIAVGAAAVALVATAGDGDRLRRGRSPGGAAQPGGRRTCRTHLRCRRRRCRRGDGGGWGLPGALERRRRHREPRLRPARRARAARPGCRRRRVLPRPRHRPSHPLACGGRRPDPSGDGRVHRCAGTTSRTPSPVAEYDPRTAEQREEYADVRAGFIERLQGEGLDDLVPLVDTNLFGISIDTRVSEADHADLARLIEIGQPMTVFIAPPPAEDDPTAL